MTTWNDALEAAARKAEALAPVTHDFGGTLSAARYDEIAAAIRALKRPEAAADDPCRPGLMTAADGEGRGP